MKKIFMVLGLVFLGVFVLPQGTFGAGQEVKPARVVQSLRPLNDPGDEFWDGRFAGIGLDSSPTALAADGDTLYAGGSFVYADGVLVNGIAEWDGTQTHALGSGVSGCTGENCAAEVRAIAARGGVVYAGGNFTNAGGVIANYVARWNGSSWQALGSGFDTPVSTLALVGNTLYAGGEFTKAGSATVNHIAKWDGKAWQVLGTGTNGAVNTLGTDGSTLYVGGDFTQANGATVNYIAKWDGAQWSAMGTGLGGPIHSLTLSAGKVYATNGGFDPQVCLATWDGASWALDQSECTKDPMNPPRGGTFVSGLATFQGKVYFSLVTTYPGYHASLYRKDENGWINILGALTGSFIGVMTASPHTLYLGGSIGVGGPFDPDVVGWTGTEYVGVFNAAKNSIPFVDALAATADGEYAGGEFSTVGGQSIEGLARWNGSSWSAVGGGIKGTVDALGSNGTDLYAVGSITEAGGSTVKDIVKWDGARWSDVGGGVDGGWANKLAEQGQNVYAAGTFTKAGGVDALHIARWDGKKWHALGAGIRRRINALAVSGNDLYVASQFTQRAELAGPIVQWDGQEWSDVGTLPFEEVTALAVQGKVLFAASRDAPYLASWNGKKWSVIQQANNMRIDALATRGEDLLLGGYFEEANNGLHGIAVLKDGVLQGLGRGLDGVAFAMDVIGRDIYVAGGFRRAGGKPAGGFSIWHDPAPLTPELSAPERGATVKDKPVMLEWTASADADRYEIQVQQGKKGKIVVFGKATTTQFETQELKPGKAYRWRVRACTGDYCSSWTPYWKFQVRAGKS